MARPRLLEAITWPKYEAAVLAVFEEGLRRLALRATLPRTEEPINFELYFICLDVHVDLQEKKRTIPFVIDFDSTNQPVLDDVVRSKRLKKRPDFACTMFNPQATDGRSSQIRYSLECKRLGAADGKWVLNENYCQHGQLRFIHEDHGYGKGCESAAMIGYVQDMDPDTTLTDVNQFGTARKLPSLKKAAAGWMAKGVTRLDQDPLVRDFDTKPVNLRHLWVDLRHCKFEVSPPANSAPVKKKPREKNVATKKVSTKKVPTKKGTKASKKKVK